MSPSAVSCRVVVVSHHSDSTLPDCVAAVLAQRGIALELVVVDNASTRSPTDYLPADPRLRVLRNGDNPGFGRACNQGAAGASADWLLFLNPDCFLPEDALAQLWAALAADQTLGLLGAQLVWPDGSDQPNSRRRDPTPQQLLRGGIQATPSAAVGAAGVEAVEAISGALMAMPRPLFEQLGGFDEGYRLHCEDLDLCRRVRLAGRAVALLPKLRVVHVKGTSSTRRPFWVEWQKHRGMWRYFSKFDRADGSPLLAALVAMTIAAHLPLAGLRAWWRARSD